MVRTVRQAVREPVFVGLSTSLKQASALMLDAHTETAVVLEEGKLAGLLTAANVADALAEGRDASRTPVGEIADRDPLLARADEPLVEAHERMRANQCDIVVAVDAGGEPLGLVEQ